MRMTSDYVVTDPKKKYESRSVCDGIDVEVINRNDSRKRIDEDVRIEKSRECAICQYRVRKGEDRVSEEFSLIK